MYYCCTGILDGCDISNLPIWKFIPICFIITDKNVHTNHCQITRIELSFHYCIWLLLEKKLNEFPYRVWKASDHLVALDILNGSVHILCTCFCQKHDFCSTFICFNNNDVLYFYC